MAGVSLLALIDDIATLLDDIGVLTKSAASKTMGVLGDDLALNAEQVSGMRAERELPVVWAVAKGSALNKLILVPTALALSWFVPWLITPLLMLGGAYLCFEGVEKVLHALLHREKRLDPNQPAPQKGRRTERLQAAAKPEVDLVAFEKERIRGAIRTDFILSAEIVVITLGTVAEAPFLTRALVVTIMAFALTVGVYVLVAGIVKVDDAGAHLVRETAGATARLGEALLWISPRLLQFLSIAGTAAMFLVGGGILVHGAPFLHHIVHGAEHAVAGIPHWGSVVGSAVVMLLNALTGAVAGGLVVGALHLVRLVKPAANS